MGRCPRSRCTSASTSRSAAASPASRSRAPWPQTFEVDYVRMYRRHGRSRSPSRACPPRRAAPRPLPTLPPTPPAPDDRTNGRHGRLGHFLPAGGPAAGLVVDGRQGRGTRGADGGPGGGRVGERGGATCCSASRSSTGPPGGSRCRCCWPRCTGCCTLWGCSTRSGPGPPRTSIAEEDPSRRPIFILIPTVNEGPDVLGPTVEGALAARAHYLDGFPEAEVTVVVCNDGYVAGYPDW